jgi:hypothetical protein
MLLVKEGTKKGEGLQEGDLELPLYALEEALGASEAQRLGKGGEASARAGDSAVLRWRMPPSAKVDHRLKRREPSCYA